MKFYQNYWQLWKNKDLAAINTLEKKKERNIAEVMYFSKERIKERIEFNNEIILEKDAVLQPIDNYILVFYAKGKVVSLLQSNGEHVLHSIIKGKNEEGDETLSTTIKLHLPKGSDKLEVI